jgi:hypothetical protein
MTTNFTKQYTAAFQNVKSGISKNIKDGLNFSCQLADIKTTTTIMVKEESEFNDQDNNETFTSQEITVYPNKVELNNWFTDLFNVELKPKVIPEKALKAMEAKGIKPAKNPTDILLIIVSASDTHVHVGISVPKSDENITHTSILNSIIEDKYNNVVIDVHNSFAIMCYPHEFPFKEKDDMIKRVYDVLKKLGINNVVDEEDTFYELEEE